MTTTAVDPNEHLGLLRFFVNRLRRPGEGFHELVSVAYPGLVRAAELYRADQGATFGTYAEHHVRGHLERWRQAERRWRCVALGRLLKRRTRHRVVLFSELGRDFVRGKARAMATVEPLGPAAAESADLRDRVAAALARLTPRHRLVLELRFGLGANGPLTLDETAVRLGVTRERTRQIEASAIGHLRRVAKPFRLPCPE